MLVIDCRLAILPNKLIKSQATISKISMVLIQYVLTKGASPIEVYHIRRDQDMHVYMQYIQV